MIDVRELILATVSGFSVLVLCQQLHVQFELGATGSRAEESIKEKFFDDLQISIADRRKT